MTVNVKELVKRAKAFSEKYSVPLAKNQFEGTLDDPVPGLPYMVWLSSHEAARGADGFNNLKAQDIDFELYTQQDNEDREKLAAAFETEVLPDVEYDVLLAPVPDEDCFQTAYEIRGLLSKMKGASRE